MSLEETSDARDDMPAWSDLINWKGLFTTLAGIGVVAVVGFVVTAWSVSTDVKTMSKKVDLLATKEEVDKKSAQAVETAKAYTDAQVGELLRKTDTNTQKLEVIGDDIREFKTEQRRENAEVKDTLREIGREMKRIQIDQAANR